MEVLIFKTSVNDLREVVKVKPLLTTPDISNWNIDLEDCDKVLRVVTDHLRPKHIEDMLHSAGFECEELPY